MDDLKAIKTFLKQAYDAQQKMDADKALLEIARIRAEGVQGVQYDKISVDGGGGKSPALAEAAVNIVQLECDLAVDIQQWTMALRNVRAIISQLPDACLRAVLERRYLRMMQFEQIAVDMGYSWRHVHRLHGLALTEAQKILLTKRSLS